MPVLRSVYGMADARSERAPVRRRESFMVTSIELGRQVVKCKAGTAKELEVREAVFWDRGGEALSSSRVFYTPILPPQTQHNNPRRQFDCSFITLRLIICPFKHSSGGIARQAARGTHIHTISKPYSLPEINWLNGRRHSR